MSDVWYKSPLFLNYLKLLNDGYQLKWATVFVDALFFLYASHQYCFCVAIIILCASWRLRIFVLS